MKRKVIRITIALVVLIALPLVVWRIHLASAINRELAEIRAMGLPTNGAELSRCYPAVPDNENSALVMTQAFALLIEFTGEQSNELARLEMPSRLQPLTDQQLNLLTGYVTLNSNALLKAESALKLSKSRYPVDFSPALYAQFPHLKHLRNLGQLEEYLAALAIQHGQHGEATDSLLKTCKIAATLDEESTIIAQLVRARIFEMAFRIFERRANASGFESNELAGVTVAMSATERTNALANSLVWDRALLMPYFRGSIAQIKPILGDGVAPDDAADLTLESGHQSIFIQASGVFERDLLLFMRTMKTNIALAMMPTPQCLSAKESNDRAASVAKKRLNILSAVFLPSYSKVIDRSVENTARIRIAKVAIAVESFRLANGRFPQNLSEPV